MHYPRRAIRAQGGHFPPPAPMRLRELMTDGARHSKDARSPSRSRRSTCHDTRNARCPADLEEAEWLVYDARGWQPGQVGRLHTAPKEQGMSAQGLAKPRRHNGSQVECGKQSASTTLHPTSHRSGGEIRGVVMSPRLTAELWELITSWDGSHTSFGTHDGMRRDSPPA
eukprot:CAMPEP_0170571138 /NCGR_PEP_ID=MMETSP0224-20130122/1497_2 /TAXON_ID=285029 /ORGANISM="Togula jolla, Strain CCCM 725" /LENGTH=168 /DNA_ID=CAMNT_0010893489 /DNA_START=1168 /DNA_END=1672 /DNA_ORIENTATION=-